MLKISGFATRFAIGKAATETEYRNCNPLLKFWSASWSISGALSLRLSVVLKNMAMVALARESIGLVAGTLS